MTLRVSASSAIGLAICAALFVLGLFLSTQWVPFRKLELAVRDWHMRTHAAKYSLTGDNRLVVVSIDDDSYSALAAVWPWPRSYYARCIRNLRRAGARLIILDIILDKPRPDDPAGDDSLASVLQDGSDVILSGKTHFRNEDRASAGVQLVYEGAPAELVGPFGKFLASDSSNWALTDLNPDIDGVVRRYYTLRRVDAASKPVPTLAVRALDKLGRAVPPVEGRDGRFTIAYAGPARTFPYISFYQVVDDSTFWTRDEQEWKQENNWFDTLLLNGTFRNKIVLIGAGVAELHDTKFTPFSIRKGSGAAAAADEVPGVEVHAAALNTLLNGYRITEMPMTPATLVTAAICLALFIAGMSARTAVYLPGAALVVAACPVTASLIFKTWGVFMPVTVMVTCVLATTVGQSAFLFALEYRRRMRVTRMFGHYVAPEVVRELVRDPAKMKIGGERRELTVLFCDLENFTSLAERMEPEEVVRMLNEYLTEMTAIIHGHGGIIDKFEGDLVMAEFGIPLAMPDHAVRACTAAFDIQKRLRELNDGWRRQSRPRLEARIGIGSGSMLFGNMGSEQVFDYTVIGDVVNLASRLEGANRSYGTRIMVNRRTAELVGTVMLVRELDLVRVKGKSRPEQCFQLIAPIDSPKSEEIGRVIALFDNGIALYRKQEWDPALVEFRKILELWPDDKPAEVYVNRCEAFKTAPPPADWDGVFVMGEK